MPLCTNSHGTLQEWVEESKARPFRFFRNEGPGDGDQKLTLNYCAEGSSEVEGAPYDIHLLKVRALVGERSLLCDLHYHVYADHGNVPFCGPLFEPWATD